MKAAQLIKIVKYTEYLVFAAAFACFALTLYGMVGCRPEDTGSICMEWGLGKIYSIRAIFFLLPIYGILNSLHIGLDHYLNVGQESYTNLFTVGLFGLSMSFILFALFKISPYMFSTAQQNLIMLIIYVVTGLTSLLLLSDTKLWLKDSTFVKTRLIVSLVYLVTSSLSAGLGVLVGLIILPINLFINSKN